MKKILFIFAIALVSCETKNITVKDTDTSINGKSIKTYEIDGCEYIGFIAGESSFLSHKGNCKGCMKTMNTVLQAVVKDIKSNQ
jgi:hypothetical protein